MQRYRGVFRSVGVPLLSVVLLGLSQWGCQPAPEIQGAEDPLPAAASTTASQTKAKPDGRSIVGQDWPRFLGPHGDGISDETGLLDAWPEQGPPLIWEKTVGTGYSAPSVREGRLVLHHRLEDQEVIDCLDAQTGHPLWHYAYPSRFQDPYGYNNGPRCTPILTATRCYTLGAEGKLLCLDTAVGTPVWQHDLKQDFDIPDGFFGVGATPVLEGDKLIVAVGGQPNSGIVAFDANDGRLLWQNVGKNTWDGASTGWDNDPVYHWEGDEMVVSYSSPMVVSIHGRRHVLCLMRQGLVSLDPETGAENFHHWFRSRTHESVNAAQPVVIDDTIMLGAAYRVGSVCLRVAADGKQVEPIWKSARNLATHWSTSIHHDGCYYGFSGRHENEAQLQCVDARSGQLLWETSGWSRPDDLQQEGREKIIDRSTGREIPWPFYGRGSAILADGKFIVLAERGTLALVKPHRDRWEEVSRCAGPRMKYPSWTAPVLARGHLYLRCEDALVCLRIMQE